MNRRLMICNLGHVPQLLGVRWLGDPGNFRNLPNERTVKVLQTTSPQRFYPEIESVRGLAALMVSGLHCYMYWPHFRLADAPIPQPILYFFMGAGAGSVTLFFVISGFVLRLSLDASRTTYAPLQALEFTLARIFRIYPAVVTVILLWAITSPWLLFQSVVWPPSLVINNALLLDATMDWPTWSARVEVAAVPLILAAWFLRRSTNERWLWVLAIVATVLSFARSLYFEDLIGRYLFVFLFGMLIPDARTSVAQRLPKSFAMAILTVVAIASVLARPLLSYQSQAAILIEAICWSAFIYILVYARVPELRFVLNTRPLRELGRISFSFFLLHFFVLWIFLRYLPNGWIDALSGGNATAATTLIWITVVIATIPLSYLSYIGIEQRGIAAGRSLRWHVGRRSRAAEQRPATL